MRRTTCLEVVDVVVVKLDDRILIIMDIAGIVGSQVTSGWPAPMVRRGLRIKSVERTTVHETGSGKSMTNVVHVSGSGWVLVPYLVMELGRATLRRMNQKICRGSMLATHSCKGPKNKGEEIER